MAPSSSSILRDAQQRLGLNLLQVWVAYIGVGGDSSLAVVKAWLIGTTEPNPRDHDFMAQSMNDYFIDRGLDHPVPYSEALAS